MEAFFSWLARQVGRDVPPVEVTPYDERYRDHLLATHRPAGVNQQIAALRAFFSWAVEAGIAATNPAAGVRAIRQARRTPRALSGQEVYRLQREAAARRQLAQAAPGGACGIGGNPHRAGGGYLPAVLAHRNRPLTRPRSA